MPTIPPNNSTGLYGIDGSSVTISNDVTVDNLAATGNITAGANIAAGNNVTVGGNLTVSGTIFGNITGNLVVPGANTQVLFNSNGNAGASSDFTFNDNTNVLNVNGNISANYFIGDGSQLTGLPATYGNANVVDLLDSFGSNVIVTTGNITGGYFIGNGSQLTGLGATYSNANVVALLAAFGSNVINTTGNITGGTFIGSAAGLSAVPGANVTGTVANATFATSAASATTAGTVTTAAQPNITSVGTLTSLSVSGNIAGGNISTAGQVAALGNISGSYILGNGSQLTGLPATYSNANVTTLLAAFGSNTISTSGNITGGNIIGNIQAPGNTTEIVFNNSGVLGTNQNLRYNPSTNLLQLQAVSGPPVGEIQAGNFNAGSGQVQALTGNLININSTTISASGNITGANIIGNGQFLTNLPGANVTGTVANATFAISAGTATTAGTANSVAGANVSGQVANALVAGTVYTAAQPNITSVGNLTSLTVTGDSLLQGNLQVNGNVTYIASNTVTINDKFINVANNAATSSAANGGGIGVGPVGAEYATWSYSDANTAWQSNIKIEAPALTTTGNVTANYFIGDGSLLTNINAGNIVGAYGNANVANFLGTGFGSNSITTTGNITGGNINGNGSGLTNLTGANVTGTVASATQANTANVANSVAGGNVSGQVANALVAGTVYTAAQPAITSVGTLTSLSVTGNATAGNVNTNAVQATGSGGLALKNSAGTTQASLGAGGGDNFAISVSTNLNGNNAQIDISPTGTGHVNIKPTGYVAIAPVTVGSMNNVIIGNATPVAANVTTLGTTGNITAAGILTDGYYYANGTPVTFGGGSTYGNANVVTLLAAFGSNTISTTGNITGGNLITGGSGGNITGANNITATGNVSTGGILTDNYYYANGTPVTFGGSSYGDANVNTLLASWGSNTLSTTGNVTVGNLNMTGQVFDSSGVLQLNAAGNIVMAPTGSVQINGPTDIIGGKLTTGAVTYANVDGTNGQVLTTYGNGITYFSTVSGGSGSPGGANTQIQFNDAGAFAGNAAMTFNNTTGNVTLGNIVVALNQQIETVSAYSGNSSVRNPGQITVGDGYAGNITNTTYLTNNARGARALSYDQYIKADNGARNCQLASLSYADMNAGNIGTANANSRMIGFSSELFVINGNTVSTSPVSVRGLQSFVTAGTSANTGNANISGTQVSYQFTQVNAGSRIGNLWMNFADTQNNGNATQSPIDTYIGYGIRPNHTANTTTGNIFGVYMPGTTSTYGQGMANAARAAGSYYFLRCDDDLAQSKLGSLRTFHEYRYDNSSSSGTLTVNKNNGQVQYITVSEDISTVSFSNFVVSATDGSTTDYQTDTVTLIFQQDATGRTITLPTPSTTYKYAGGANTMGTTANAVQMVSVTATYNAGLAGTQYLITVSPEFE
jgi:hypothetical protein